LDGGSTVTLRRSFSFELAPAGLKPARSPPLETVVKFASSLRFRKSRRMPSRVLLAPFEEEFDRPAAAIQIGDVLGG
jgi:hypothetical protein